MSFTTDIQINKPFPALEYNGTETGALYYEDREVGGVMYRVQNATFTGSQWKNVVITLPAYALAFLPSGTVEFLTSPASSSPFSTWSTVYSSDSSGNMSAQLAADVGSTPMRIFNVKAYGAKGDNFSNDSSAISNAITAANAANGGIIFFPAGTYKFNSVNTLSETVPIVIMGEGIDVSILTAYSATDHVLGMFSTGIIRDLTIDGGKLSTHGLVISNITSASVIDVVTLQNVKIGDISTSGGYVLLVQGIPGTGSNINLLILDSVILQGPCNAQHDSLGISNVTTCFVSNLTLRNLTGSPTFEWITYLAISGCYITGCGSSLPSLIIDNNVSHALISGLIVDATNVNWPVFQSPDCTVSASQFLVPYINVGSTGVNLASVAQRFVGCEIISELAYAGNGAISLLEVVNSRVAPATSVQACILNDQSSPSLANVSVRNSVLDTSKVSLGAFASSVAGSMTDSQFISNVVLGNQYLIHTGSVSVGSGCTIRGNTTTLASTTGGPKFVGQITPNPPIPNGKPWWNDTGYDCVLYIAGGTATISSIVVGAGTISTFLTSGSFALPNGQQITVTWGAHGTPAFTLVPDSIQ